MTLKFLADESCDFKVVRVLRDEGYDVVAVSEYMQRSDDRELIQQAERENRIFLTEDKDFGWLVYASQEETAAVIFIRFPGKAREKLGETIRILVREHEEELSGAFVVVQPSRIRIRPHLDKN